MVGSLSHHVGRAAPQYEPTNTSTNNFEFECVVYGVAVQDSDRLRERIHAMRNDLSNHIPVLDIEETVYIRRGSAKTSVANSLNTVQEVRLRRIAGNQVPSSKIYDACAIPHKTETVKIFGEVKNEKANSNQRFELVQYGHFQRDRIKQLKVPVRSMIRVQISGQIEPFVSRLGFQLKYRTFTHGERIQIRDGIEVDLYHVTKKFGDDEPLVLQNSQSPPLLVSIRAICVGEAEIDRTTKKVRRFVDDISVCPYFQEIQVEEFLPALSIR